MLSDKEIIEIALGFRDGILDGESSSMMCAAICWPLHGYLAFMGMESLLIETLYGDCNHLWIELPDGRALDPTADQFLPELPPIYLGPKLEIHRDIA